MFLSILLAALGSPQSFVGRPDLECAGGATIFFARGSAEIDTAAANRLEGFILGTRSMHIVGFVTVESDGHDAGGFDAALSRRRSQAIQAFLQKRGYQVREMNIAVGEHAGWGDDSATAMVSVLIPREEYQRRFPGVALECF